MTSDLRRVPDDEVDGAEGWERLTDEPEVRGVEALRGYSREWPWMVSLWAMEFVREDPLESELREEVARALRAVPGVTDVAEEDREVWVVAGQPSGEGLVGAASTVVDQLAHRIRAYVTG